MPTYEYQCEKCGHKLEKFQSMTAPVLRKCPKCGKSSLKRLIGAGAGVIFKGSGFYQTDYPSDSYKQSVKKESDSGSKKEEKKDSKPEVKTPPSPEKSTPKKKDKKPA
ncbi:MAG: zinc ribbon domain-containing protein [Phycisphaerae bacterium]